MNELAESMGYVIGSPKKDFQKAKEEQQVRIVSIARDHVIKALTSKGSEKQLIVKIVDEMLKKYSKQFMSGEYSLLTMDELIAVGNGTIIDEKAQVVVWTRQQYLAWEDMDEIC